MKRSYPEVAVGTIITNKQGKVLLARSYKWPGLYQVPGGHVEFGESIEQTARREAKEEVGLDIRFKKVLNVQEATNAKGFYEKRHFIFIDALCASQGSKVKLDNNELQDYIWIKPRDALKLKLNSYTRVAIKMLAENKKKWFYAQTK